MTVSLITTVLNCEKYLVQAIESVLGQTCSDWELIIWDDGSIDASFDIAKAYAASDTRISVYEGIHVGRPAALQRAIEKSSGKYLGFLDADDWLHPSALAETVKILDSLPEIGMVYTDYWDVLETGKLMGLGKRCRIPYSFDRLLVDFMTFQFRLIRKDVYLESGGIDLEFPAAQDYDLCLKISEIARIHHLSQPLYYYRRNPKGISKSLKDLQRQCSALAVRKAITRRNLPLTLEIFSDGRFRLKPQC
jgi:glycosyltransferase involved in cell wall biosynthesis